MSKFCIFCGTPLEEGTVCNCQINNNMANEENNIQGVNNEFANNNQQEGSFLDALKLEKDLILKPFSASKTLVQNDSMLFAIWFFIMQAVASSVFALLMVKEMFGENVADSVISNTGVILTTMIVSVALSFVFALLLWVMAKLFRYDFDYVDMMNLTALRSGTLVATSIIAIIVMLFEVSYGLVVFFFGNIVALIVVAVCFPAINDKERNSIHIILFVVALAFMAISVKVMSKASVYYLKEETREFIQEMDEEFDIFEGISESITDSFSGGASLW